jgi:NAD(P)-dependent dehydrogenase (short-subunit alcohol dehydrogenase family)
MKKYAVVTGGCVGIGYSIAKKFGKESYKVYLVDKEEKELKKAHKELLSLKIDCEIIKCDIRNWDSAETIFKEIPAVQGDWVVLINNAGIKNKVNLLTESESTWTESITVMLQAPFRLSQHFIDLAAKIKFKGSICNIGSVVSNLASSQSPAYHAAKAGLAGLTNYLAVTAFKAGAKIKTNLVEPGLIIQDRHLNIYRDIKNIDYVRATRFYQPGREVGRENDVAEAVFWICSDKSKFINGVTLKIDGGGSLQEQFELLEKFSKEISKNK